MAEFSKYKSIGLRNLFLHNNRRSEDGITHNNKEIDKTRTVYNYHIKEGTYRDVQNRLKEVFRRGKSDETVLAEMIVTLPRDVRKEDERKFFKLCYSFYAKDFGEENIVNAVVHKDETTPHIHIDFVPVIKGEVTYHPNSNYAKELKKWKETHTGELERLCCAKLVDRNYLRGMHSRLHKYIAYGLGYEVEIINGATINGNKEVLELKSDTIKERIAKNEVILQNMEDEIKKLYVLSRRCGFEPRDISLIPLVEKIETLERQNEILQDIIRKNNYTYTSEQLISLKGVRFQNVKSSSLSIHSGSLLNADISTDGIIVIEVQSNDREVKTPQRVLFDSYDIERPFRRFLASREEVWLQPSRHTDNLYLFIKANDINQIATNLLTMQALLMDDEELAGRKLYMEQLEYDTYNFARNILEKCDRPVQYYIKSKKTGIDKQVTKEYE